MTDAQTLARRLSLPRTSKALREKTRRAFVEGDALGMLVPFGNEAALNVVVRNLDALRERGIYESALFHAWITVQTNWARWPLDILCALFDIADRERLLAAGDRMPEGERFTLYQGVAGKGPRRKEAGLSWTRSLEKARWFADRRRRRRYADPGIYITEAARNDVYLYTAQRGEEEFVLCARSWRRMTEA